jgi:hypothetical protein
VPAANALDERRWAWEFDPKPSRDSVRGRDMYVIARAHFEQLRAEQANVNVRIAVRVRPAGAELNVYARINSYPTAHLLAPYRTDH